MRSATRSRNSGGFLFGLFTGVILGLAVSLGIAFYLNRTPIPFVSAKQKPAEKDAKAPAIAGLPQTAAAPTPAQMSCSVAESRSSAAMFKPMTR